MQKSEARALIQDALPADGEVSWASVYNSLQSTPEGREAAKMFHALRRDDGGAPFARYDRKTRELFVSRSPYPVAENSEHIHEDLNRGAE